jgi:hypothetical protein
MVVDRTLEAELLIVCSVVQLVIAAFCVFVLSRWSVWNGAAHHERIWRRADANFIG